MVRRRLCAWVRLTGCSIDSSSSALRLRVGPATSSSRPLCLMRLQVSPESSSSFSSALRLRADSVTSLFLILSKMGADWRAGVGLDRSGGALKWMLEASDGEVLRSVMIGEG